MTKVESYLGRAMYPSLTFAGKTQAAKDAKLERRRKGKNVNPDLERQWRSPLGGVAVETPKKGK
jgi:hypothetical protein